MLETKIKELRETILNWRKDGLKIGLVPTMGALHEGHLSLIKQSVKTCDKTVVSVFVNPIQFGPSEDLDKYPRTLEADMKFCKEANADLVFSPSVNEMYGDTPHPNPPPQGGREQSVELSLYESSNRENLTSNSPSPLEGEGWGGGTLRLSNDFFTYVVPPYFYVNKLCGKSRVGHFDGVCTIVNKLFNIVQPDVAFFGQKDAQQFIIIKKMVEDLNIPIELVQCPIVRNKKGLALSSRNQYLSEKGKEQALVLNKILTNIKTCYNKGITDTRALGETAFSFLNEHHELEYLEFVDKDNLDEKTIADDNTLVLIALKLENVRLIDNCFIK